MDWSLDGAHDTSHTLTYDVAAGGERIRLAWRKCGDCGLEMLQSGRSYGRGVLSLWERERKHDGELMAFDAT